MRSVERSTDASSRIGPARGLAALETTAWALRPRRMPPGLQSLRSLRSASMNQTRFDALARAQAVARSRRRLLRLLGALVLGGSAVVGHETTEARRHHKKRRCHPACVGGMVCHRGQCGCPAPQEACDGQCYDPCQGLPSSGQTAARHPVTCACCLRPGSFNCDQTGSLPCCAQACNPLEVEPTCREFDADQCHFDVDCFPTQYCPPGNEPRRCADIPT